MNNSAEEALGVLHPAVRRWFEGAFGEPSPPQRLGWPAVAAGRNVLLLAPTGSGKTLAAFLQCISSLYRQIDHGKNLDGGVRVLYISPLKALNNDIHKNLELPLAGVASAAAEMGLELPLLHTAVRTGDTPSSERRKMLRTPPHILITTPESLFLMLASGSRSILRTVQYVIVDEIHALFPTKRGVHLAVSLEHLESLAGRPFQRIGLSATQRPLEEVAAFLGGGISGEDVLWHQRPVDILDTGQRKTMDLRIALPVDDFRSLPEGTVWPRIYGQLLGMIREHRTTLVFVNNRRLAERITANVNELAGDIVARTHHGSLSRQQRIEVEGLLKSGLLPCIVATSSLELGIDVGSIDLVVQVESPKGVARGLQRVGRAGHLVGMPSKGRVIPKTNGDLLECAALVREMSRGLVEEMHAPENCLDVLAQQVVGMTCVSGRGTSDLFKVVRGAYPYRHLPRSAFESVLNMLSGGFDNGDFAELQPRIFWDRINEEVRASDRGRRLVYTSGGTIPDRGYFGVYMAGTNARLGELDEEFVAERRLGERFILGTSTWRIEELRQDRVIVSPSGRGDAQVPFWKGEGSGRGAELGERLGAFAEELSGRLGQPGFEEWLCEQCLMDEAAARNLHGYIQSQIRSTGALPSHRRIIIEEYPDELGEWRVVLHSPYGERVHGALALLIQAQLKQKQGIEVEVLHDDNGILLHCPGADTPPPILLDELPLETLEETMADLVRGSRLFALTFRHNAARALILPRGSYGQKRTPLWLARLRASDLLQVVSEYPEFPITLESLRECLQQAFDLDGVKRLLRGIRVGNIAVQQCRHQRPSPFTQSLQFSFYGSYMYVLDMPKGEQRFRALGLSREALLGIMGEQSLRSLLDPEEIRRTAAEARGTLERRLPRNADEMHAWLIRHGEWRDREAFDGPPEFCAQLASWLDELKVRGRVARITIEMDDRMEPAWIASEDLPVYLAAFHGRLWAEGDIAPPSGMDADEAVNYILRRYARSSGPFSLADAVARFGFGERQTLAGLAVLQAGGQVQAGAFTPGIMDTEWCDVGVLQRIHRRSLARARREIAPRGPAEFVSFIARWQGVAGPARGTDALAAVLTRLSGLWLPATAWGGGVLPCRVEDYQDSTLERLIGSGQYTWIASGSGGDMRLAFQAFDGPAIQMAIDEGDAESEDASRVREAVAQRGALFLPQIVQSTGLNTARVLDALEELAAAGAVTNDTMGPVRFFAARRPSDRRHIIGPAVISQMGRWSLIAAPNHPDPEGWAGVLIQRYGLVTRDIVAREGIAWSDLAGVFDRWEAVGKVRRGYFVEGLAGVQYMLPEAVESLRLPPGDGLPEFWALLWPDPANPYCGVLPIEGRGEWSMVPEFLVIRRGQPVLAAGGKKLRLITLGPLDDASLTDALRPLMALAGAMRSEEGRLIVAEFDGKPIGESPVVDILKALGFERGYQQMERWSPSI